MNVITILEAEIMAFQDKIQTVKGELAEELVDLFYSDKDYIIYKANGPHICDRFYINDKQQIRAVETKCKPCRDKYDDTGVDYDDHVKYLKLWDMYKIRTYLIFVDEKLGKAYGGWLDQLMAPKTIAGVNYPHKAPPDARKMVIMYYPTTNMTDTFKLTTGQINRFKSLSAKYQSKIELAQDEIDKLHQEQRDEWESINSGLSESAWSDYKDGEKI